MREAGQEQGQKGKESIISTCCPLPLIYLAHTCRMPRLPFNKGFVRRPIQQRVLEPAHPRRRNSRKGLCRGREETEEEEEERSGDPSETSVAGPAQGKQTHSSSCLTRAANYTTPIPYRAALLALARLSCAVPSSVQNSSPAANMRLLRRATAAP